MQSKISLIHTISTSPAHGTRPTQIGQEVRRYELLIDDLREMADDLQDHRRAFDSKAALWRLGRACRRVTRCTGEYHSPYIHLNLANTLKA
jgi:hypothetical protein